MTLDYDLSNRVSGLSHPDGAEQYRYAPDNRRVWRSAGRTACYASRGNDQEGYWSGYGEGAQEQVILYSPGGQKMGAYCLSFSQNLQYFAVSASEENVYYGGRLVGKRLLSVTNSNNGLVSDFTADRLQSKGNGSNYYPYGESKSSTAGDDREGFATYTRDEKSGLDYANQRYRSVNNSSFTTPDPLSSSMQASRPSSLNRYSYAESNPIELLDPEGTNNCWISSHNFGPGTPFAHVSCFLDGSQTSDHGMFALGPDAMSLNDNHRLLMVAQEEWEYLAAPGGMKNVRQGLRNISRNSFSKCASTLTSLTGASIGDIQAKARLTAAFVHDGTNNTTIWDESFGNLPGSVPSGGGPITMKLVFGATPGLNAISSANSPDLYIDPAAFGNAPVGFSGLIANLTGYSLTTYGGDLTAYGEASLLHEVLHKFGLTDRQLENALGVSNVDAVTWGTASISRKLKDLCW